MKTVLNTMVVDTTKQPLFLGEPLSLQRYDKCKYEQFLDLFKKEMKEYTQEKNLIDEFANKTFVIQKFEFKSYTYNDETVEYAILTVKDENYRTSGSVLLKQLHDIAEKIGLDSEIEVTLVEKKSKTRRTFYMFE